MRSLRTSRAILFDLDGTLLDSLPAHYRVYERVLADLGVSIDEDTYARTYSPNWYLFYERIRLPRERWPDADRLWLQYYAHETPGPRDGAAQVLAAVKASGRALGLVTSGDHSRVQRDLRRVGWDPIFDVVVCSGDTPHLKPHPAPLLRALECLRVQPVDAVYVGDTVEDVRMGKNAGTVTAAVTGGFSSRETLCDERPDVLLDRLQQLVDLL